MDVQLVSETMWRYISYAVIGVIASALLVIDAWANDKIEHPQKANGETDRLKTLAIYLTSIGFGGFASVGGGILASDYFAFEGSLSYLFAGLSGFAGKDIISIVLRKFKRKVENV